MQAEQAHEHTHSPTPQPGVAGRSRNPSPNTHTHTAHPCYEWLGASGARTRAHTQPNTPARSGRAQPEPEPKHTHPHRAPVPGVAGCKRSTDTNTHTPSPQPGKAGRSRNQDPTTHTHTAHPSQEWRGASGARIRAHTQPNTPATSGGAQPKPELKHTDPTGAPVPGVAGCRRSAHTSTHTAQHPSQEWRGAPGNPSLNTHNHTAHPCQEWLGASRARTQTRTPQHPSQEWRGAAETRAQTHTATLRIQARSGRVQAERAHEPTHSPTPQPGVGGWS